MQKNLFHWSASNTYKKKVVLNFHYLTSLKFHSVSISTSFTHDKTFFSFRYLFYCVENIKLRNRKKICAYRHRYYLLPTRLLAFNVISLDCVTFSLLWNLDPVATIQTIGRSLFTKQVRYFLYQFFFKYWRWITQDVHFHIQYYIKKLQLPLI